MRTSKLWVVAAFSAALATGCVIVTDDDDDTTGVTVADGGSGDGGSGDAGGAD